MKREKCIYEPEVDCESPKSDECDFFCAIAHGIWKPKRGELNKALHGEAES
jgi:hypothetical protein